MPPKPRALTVISLFNEESIAPVKDALMPPTKIVTNTTRPMPIMSAAAVTAVRAGLRAAFSDAMRPTPPATAPIGTPSTLTTGRTM